MKARNVVFAAVLSLCGLSGHAMAEATYQVPKNEGTAAPPSAPSSQAARIDVNAPPGGVLKSVMLRVTVVPATGAVAIYGSPPGAPVVVKGGGDVRVPTADPVVFVDGFAGATKVTIDTLGWEERRDR